ncbi:MAG TPA: hypothetical protein PLS07_03230 [Niabella sp.]|nr:hypothetical protein [Niabella sp.]HQW14075.1 hypothetical protein [Niabella sp.]HQX19382.1 hypothetical protein [Niabella sp.]HQX40265.1 hypothetical protein [Niabella sp.]HRB05599.1 hypothetical protein [Niabella sp.]
MKFISAGYLFFILLTLMFSCKKDEAIPQTNEARFIGLWVESSAKKDTVLVTQGDGETGPVLFLYPNGKLAIPFTYSFYANGDSVKLSNMSSSNMADRNVPYKIIFPDNQTFTINRFHSSLPAQQPLTFNRVLRY